MTEQKIDFDEQELHDVVLSIVEDLVKRFNDFERTHGSNFTASLAATLAKELLVRLATTSDSLEQIQSTWQKVNQEAYKSLIAYAKFSKHMNEVNPGVGKPQ